MKFKLLKDANFVGRKGDVVDIKDSNHIAILKFNRYIDKEYIEPKTKAKTKRTTKKDTHTDSD